MPFLAKETFAFIRNTSLLVYLRVFSSSSFEIHHNYNQGEINKTSVRIFHQLHFNAANGFNINVLVWLAVRLVRVEHFNSTLNERAAGGGEERTGYLHLWNTTEMLSSIYITRILRFTFDGDKYAPLYAAPADEALWTESNGGNCYTTFHLECCNNSACDCSGLCLKYISKLMLFCLVYLTICALLWPESVWDPG